MSFKVIVKGDPNGFRTIIRNFTKIEGKKLNQVVDAVQITQALVMEEAKKTVPVRTANLQNSIGPGRIDIRPTQVTGRIFALMPYASYVEFGTSRQRAKPYLGPAILKNQAIFRKLVTRAAER